VLNLDTEAQQQAGASDEEPGPPPGRLARAGHRGNQWLCLALVALGLADRLRQFLSGRSQWLDEVELSSNIVDRGYLALVRPLEYGQVAPVGYLWAEHTLVLLFGSSDHVLRLLPLVAALASVLVFWRLSAAVLRPWAVPVALATFAFSAHQVYYGGEAKPYSGEVLVSLTMVWLTLWLVRRPVTWRRALVWGGAGALGALFATPAVLILAGCSAVVGAVVLYRRSLQQILAAVLAGLLWGASFLVAFSIQLRQVGGSEAVHAFWTRLEAFAPQPIRPRSTLHWLPRMVQDVSVDPIGSTHWLLLAAAVLVGLGVLAVRRQYGFVGVTSGILAMAVLAAVVDRYPLGQRLALYLVPLVLICAAATVDLAPPRWAVLGLVPAVLVLFSLQAGLRGGYQMLLHPELRSQSKPVLGYLAAHRRPTDLILAHDFSTPAVTYYGAPLGVVAGGSFAGHPSRAGCRDQERLAPLRAVPRFWVIFTHLPPGETTAGHYPHFLSRFQSVGRVVDHVGDVGADAYLFETDRAELAPSQAVPWAGWCLTLELSPAAAR
jgi:hypothetical protein